MSISRKRSGRDELINGSLRGNRVSLSMDTFMTAIPTADAEFSTTVVSLHNQSARGNVKILWEVSFTNIWVKTGGQQAKLAPKRRTNLIQFVMWYIKTFRPEYMVIRKIDTVRDLKTWVKNEWPGWHVAENPNQRIKIKRTNGDAII